MEQIKVEILNYKPVDKGALRGYFALMIHPQGQRINDCRYFEHGESRWFNMPQREVKYTDGRKTEYFPIVSYANKSYEAALKSAVVEAIQQAKAAPNAQGHQAKQAQAQSNLQGDAPPLW